ncbi:MAG: universal stress protein [Wenzhouxiangella sp.]|nr:universal stress protein [Wenzhouxiangella sp.]MCH8478119.1 universal stress protein [Wenzhouxiangella sp.]TVR94755.1 MAG: universal stress protein [Wenzhouxiangellaceae bacterium]
MTENIKEILVPVDGSVNSIRAARFAMEMASAMNVGVRLFYVFPAASVEIIGMAGMSRADIDQAAQAAAQRAFDETREALGSDMIEQVEQETSIGDPAEEIIRYTEDDQTVMVVLGRRGLSRMKSLMLGSVSDKVIRHARSPVTVIT